MFQNWIMWFLLLCLPLFVLDLDWVGDRPEPYTNFFFHTLLLHLPICPFPLTFSLMSEGLLHARPFDEYWIQNILDNLCTLGDLFSSLTFKSCFPYCCLKLFILLVQLDLIFHILDIWSQSFWLHWKKSKFLKLFPFLFYPSPQTYSQSTHMNNNLSICYHSINLMKKEAWDILLVDFEWLHPKECTCLCQRAMILEL